MEFKQLFKVLFLLLSANLIGQRYIPSGDSYTFKINGLVYLIEFNQDDNDLGTELFHAIDQNFVRMAKYTKTVVGGGDKANIDYYIVTLSDSFFYEIVPDEKIQEYLDKEEYNENYTAYKKISKKKHGKSEIKWAKDDPKVIDFGDLGKYFAIKVSDFDKLVQEKYILKRYRTLGETSYPLKLAYGAQISVPFKIRFQIEGQPLRLTPELSLGGFVGGRIRLKKYDPVYWYPIVGSFGAAVVGINQNNTIDESTIDGDSKVFALYGALGSVVRFGDFQLGFMGGMDWVTGDLGEDWVYQGKPWFSAAIGFNFLDSSSDGKGE